MGQCGPESDDLQMDAWGIDVAVSSSTSGVMAPAALSLIAMGAGALASLDRLGTDVARPSGYLDLQNHLRRNDRPLLALPGRFWADCCPAISI